VFEVVTSLRYNVFGTTKFIIPQGGSQMSLYSESKQLYFSFVYDEYMHKHSEFKYLLDLINQIDWSVIPEFNNPHVGRAGYSRRSLLKAMFVQKVK